MRNRYSDKFTITKLGEEHIEIVTPVTSLTLRIGSIDKLRFERCDGKTIQHKPYWWVAVSKIYIFEFSQRQIAQRFYNELREYYPVKSEESE